MITVFAVGAALFVCGFIGLMVSFEEKEESFFAFSLITLVLGGLLVTHSSLAKITEDNAYRDVYTEEVDLEEIALERGWDK